MAIFPRRAIQAMIDRSSQYMKARRIREVVARLNCEDGSQTSVLEAIRMEWELAITDAASRCGNIQYEVAHPDGQSLPDVLYRGVGERAAIEFLFDITAISDQHAEQLESQATQTLDRLKEQLAKSGRNPRFLKLDILTVVEPNGRHVPGAPRNERDFQWLLDQVCEFFDDAVTRPTKERSREIRHHHVCLSMTYCDTGDAQSTFHSSYSVPTSVTANPLFGALARKNDQLLKSGYKGYLGVFVCDGNSRSIKNCRMGRSYAQKTSEEIVRHAFGRLDAIDFVVLLETEWFISPDGYTNERRLNRSVFFRTAEAEAAIAGELNLLINELPPVSDDAQNARYVLKSDQKYPGLSYAGGWEVNGNEIRISARALVEVLAGSKSLEDFMREHRFAADPSRPGRTTLNPFASFLALGNGLSEVSLLPSMDDDNWLVFRFTSDSDPALTAYRLPCNPDKKR